MMAISWGLTPSTSKESNLKYYLPLASITFRLPRLTNIYYFYAYFVTPMKTSNDPRSFIYPGHMARFAACSSARVSADIASSPIVSTHAIILSFFTFRAHFSATLPTTRFTSSKSQGSVGSSLRAEGLFNRYG